LSASSVFLVEDSIGVIGNLKPQIGPLISSPFLVGSFSNFQVWKIPGRSSISHQEIPPKLLPVSCNIKGKVRVWGTPNHLKWDFGAENDKKRFLSQKYKNN